MISENGSQLDGPHTILVNKCIDGIEIRGVWPVYDTGDVAAAIAYTDKGPLKIIRRNNSRVIGIEDLTISQICGGCGFGSKTGYLEVPFGIKNELDGDAFPFAREIAHAINYRAK